MSQQTWNKKHYPVAAEDCPDGGELEHTLLKYEGALPRNLKKHGLKLAYDEDYDCQRLEDNKGPTQFFFDSGTCAPCKNATDCNTCVFPSLCFVAFEPFCNNGRPTPMIKLVKKLLAERDKAAMKKQTQTKGATNVKD